MARRVDLRDEDDTVINNTNDRDYAREDRGTNWLPLLIIPLLLGGLLWGLQSYSQNARNDGSEQQFGVGGGPVVTQAASPTVSPTMTMTPTPTLSPSPMEGNTDVVPNELSPTNMGDDTL